MLEKPATNALGGPGAAKPGMKDGTPDLWSHDGVSESEISAHLSAVLGSKAFLSSHRCSAFLRYVVDRTLAQDASQLKEGAIALAVFDRTSVVEGIDDSVVRVCAREVRKHLERYYSEDGAADSIRIQLPVGSYVPRFQKVPEQPSPGPESSPPQLDVPALAANRAWRKAAIWTGAVLIVSCAFAVGHYQFGGSRRCRQFWAPVNNHPQPALVCIGPTVVYGFSRRMHEAFLRQNPSALDVGRELFQFPPGATIPAEDLVPFTDDHFTIGTLDAAIRIAQLLERAGKPSLFRLGSSISEEEARRRPIILVGAFSNPWTLEWTRYLPFYFHREIDKAGVYVSIRDRKDPSHVWSIPYSEVGSMTVDYAIISRVMDPTTRNPIIAIAGLTYYGTQAAAAFVTDQNLWDSALRNAPSGWPSRNFEAVLETSVINRTPNRTKILTQAVW